ncbi:Dynein heavy chain 6, axonemal, partial [Operophtera brumata]
MFEGREIQLVASCAAFITMNPGYAGRTELPDNLKALFRPISMMVPDYALIAEVILYSEGFQSSRGLAKKMVQMYKLASEQLSKQDHYDFGMRAVKSVLVMAGSLKRASPDQAEEMTLLCALNDSNLPKFLAADATLFAGILSDLFPGVSLPFRDYGVMEDVIQLCLRKKKLQIEMCQINKVIQLHETMIVRWGVMLVGPTGGGKTVVLHILGDTYTTLFEQEVPGSQNHLVHKYIMNPKIDAVWIENMNTVLDDNKMLCLSNSERIKLTPYVHMLFEVADLAQASPATVSRCGMVYIDPHEMGYLPLVRSWLELGVEKNTFTQENADFLYELFRLLKVGITHVNTKCLVGIKQVDISKVSALCFLLGALLSEPGERFADKAAIKTYIAYCFIFSYIWCIGGNILENNRSGFEEVIKGQLEEFEEAEYFPQGFNFFDMYMDTKARRLKVWAEIIPLFCYDSEKPFFETLVPTIDTVRYGYLFEKLLGSGKPVMFTGSTVRLERRQLLDFGGLYDRDKLYWKDILDVVLTCACAPPGGGRNALTGRFVRHFAMFYISAPNSEAMKTIFKAILKGHMEDFVPEVSCLGDSIVNAAVDVYLKICAELLPTPAKSHYVFNLRDLSKSMQGVLQADAAYMRLPQAMLRLFYHECLRVFHDRLINIQDKSYFLHLMSTVCQKNFQQPILDVPEDEMIEHPPMLLFGDFLNSAVPKENRVYAEIPDMAKLMIVLKEYLQEYNSTARAEMHLVLFQDAVEHVVRVARVLRAERGHCLMVGPGGSGRRSVATLAGHVNECKCMGMELKRNYDTPEFHDDLRNMYMRAGVSNEDTVFLFTDTQITKEGFLEDINNMLNSGEVPNLFEGDTYEQVQTGCRPDAAKSGINPSDRDAVYYFFINRVRGKLHLCICMSPVGEAFRRRCRMFPSLVNCCTIDWFTKWPAEALLSVAEQCLQPLGNKEIIGKISHLCVNMHEDADAMTDRLYNEIRRYFYTTPSSYLDLLKLYLQLLDKKQQQIIRGRDRISCGLSKLYETYEVVGVMEQQVREMEPILAKKADEGIALVNRLKIEQKSADEVKHAVMKDEAAAKIKAEEVKQIADEAKADLALAMPAMEAAQNALKALNKADINELKAFLKPPALVRFVMEPICILFGSKPDWDNTKKLLGDVNFIGKLEEYDKDHISDAILKKIKVYLVHKDFNPDTVVKVSKVCRSMVLWVQAIDMHKEAAGILKSVMAVLRAKQKEVEEIEAQLAKMLAELKTATYKLHCTTGDIIVASGCIAYFGAFPSHYRRELEVKWIKLCSVLEIPSSDTFDLIAIMADSFTVRTWNSQGLPRDSISTENGILVTRAGRWPLTIDPQEQAGRLLIHLGDSDIEYDSNFRLYLTTKLANPHYLPEICIQVTLVNFTVTLSGLEDQLLAPDLEILRSELIVRINTDKATLLEIEDKILRLLYASSGNILDDEELIETLNESKETSEIINARLEETEATEISISAAREKYRTAATRGAVLYFAVAQLADIDPMYQFSLKYFNQRLEILHREITLSVYQNVSRGLFEKHKLVFSFLLNMAIYLNAELVSPDQWNFILRGPAGTKVVPSKKPAVETLSDAMWLAVNHLNETDPTFKGLEKDCLKRIPVHLGSFSVEIHVNKKDKSPATVKWDEKLSAFEKLMLIKSLKEEKLVFAIAQYVSTSLGPLFIESPTFATEMGVRDKVQSISLGQGQGPVAEKMIMAAKHKGDWNCHLAASWMLSLELIVANLAGDHGVPHPEFRLFMSSMPTPKFPVSVLQNSVKVTNEPPKGLKANVKRALIEMEEDFFENHIMGQDWRSMLFGICMFHAIIQERKKFGPLGWNITYEFNNSDRECAMSNLQMFCVEGHIPWDALEYITSSITYGGRVTDMWDQRCLKTILKKFFAPPTLEEGYAYSESGTYYCPQADKLEVYKEYMESLPAVENPEVFGMHENANIAFENKETTTLIQTIVDVQPRAAGGGGGDTPDQIVWRICDHTRITVPRKIDMTTINPDLMEPDDHGQLNSLTTVLLHESERFNGLLSVIHSSLNELQKAIKGLVVMSEDFEAVFIAFLNNRVPQMWHKKGYNSLKSLGSWVHDLKWLLEGLPPSSWVSGLFFPQGLLTGSLQAYARRFRVPIDALLFDFEPIPFFLSQEDVYKYNKNRPKLDSRYDTPLYKTAERAGTLSTTGHSTNFVLPVLLPANQPSSFWIIRGTALLTQVTD